jgi:tetratricopeptide (TPR) repeat protein
MDRSAFETQVKRILSSGTFASKAQLRRLLEILTAHCETQSTLKPDRVMQELWPGEKDRTSADLATARNRLRKALEAYYAGEGAGDEVLIRLPKRVGEETPEHRAQGWITAETRAKPPCAPPVPEPAEKVAEVPVAGPAAGPGRRRAWAWAAGGAAALLILAGTALVWLRNGPPGFHGAAFLSLPTAKAAKSEAKQLCLRGRYYWNLRTTDGLRAAIDNYAAAIAKDPKCAEAYAGLAQSYDLLPQFAHADLGESLMQAKAAADHALELDPNLAAAHRAKGFALFFWDWDIPGSDAEFRRALELDPNSAQTHQWYASTLLSRLEGAACIKEIDEAVRLDPESPAIATDAAFMEADFGDLDKGIREMRDIEQTQPTLASPPDFLAEIYFAMGDFPNYIGQFRRYAAIAGNAGDTALADAVTEGWLKGGKRGVLLARARLGQDAFVRGTERGGRMGETWLMLGDAQKALPYFKTAVQRHDMMPLYLEACGWKAALEREPGYGEFFAMLEAKGHGWSDGRRQCPKDVPRAP